MAEMIALKSEIGSKAVTVVCPDCGRISRQILRKAYTNSNDEELLSAHTCPVCGSVYHTCNSVNAGRWKAAFSRYTINADSYNAAVKQDFAARSSRIEPDVITIEYQTESSSDRDSMDNADNTKALDVEPMSQVLAQVTEKNAQENKASEKPAEINATPSVEQDDPNMTMMDRKIDRWKKELLDTGKRNKMINYRETKRATLRILEPDPTVLFNQLAISEKTLTFQRPISKDSDFRTYSMLALLETLNYSLPVQRGDIKAAGTIGERDQTLRNMRSKTKLAQEEQGTNILYLCFGFIYWRESNRANAQWLKSPLLMMPVSLGLKSLNAPFTLSKYDDEIEVNPTLDYLFNQDYGIDLPTFELKNKNSFEEYMSTVEELVDKKGWKLVREVSLGLLSFLKISMYHDLNNHRELIEKSPVLQAIAGNRYAIGDLPAKAINFNFDESQPSEWHEVVDSDSSQEEAILLSKLGVSFVMQGPPGTGKSQTITNIIAEALADGKKVLFVSEKAAALQVVLKRLTEVHLDDFCLSLHNYKANKKEIIDNIGANLNLRREYVNRTVLSDLTELFHDRKYLDEYAEDLHKTIDPFGESIYMVFGKLSKLSDATVIEFKMDNPKDISREQYSSLLYVVDAFEKALHNMGGKLSDNPWYMTTATSSGQTFKSEMLASSGDLQKSMESLDRIIAGLNNEYGTSISTTWSGICYGMNILDSVLHLPYFPVEWRSEDKRNMLRSRALKEEKIDHAEQGHAKKLAELVNSIDDVWKMDSLCISADDLRDAFQDISLWTGSGKPDSLNKCNQSSIHTVESIINSIKTISENYQKATELLGITYNDYPSSLRMVSRILPLVLDVPELDAAWFDIRKTDALLAQVEETDSHKSVIKEKEGILLESWEPEVLELETDEMLARFKTEYTGMFHRFKGNYKEDIKQIKLLSKKVGALIEESDVIKLLQEIGEINNEKQWFEDNEGRLKSAFPNHYIGLDTDWERISTGICKAAEIARQFPYANIPERAIDAIGRIGGSIQLGAEARKLADKLTEDTVNQCLNTLQAEGLIDDKSVASSLSESILPNAVQRMEQEKERREIIRSLDDAKRNGYSTYSDVANLVANALEVRQECIWFRENIPDIVSELNIATATVNETISKEIAQSELILKNHDAIAEKDETVELTELFGNRYTGNFTDWQSVIRDIDAVDEFERSGQTEGFTHYIQIVSDNEDARILAKDRLQKIKTLMEATEPKLNYFEKLFPEINMREMPLMDVAEKYETCLNSFGELNKWLDYIETRAECDQKGLKGFTERIAAQNNTVEDVKAAFERCFYTQWLALAIEDVPAVQSFRRRVHEQRLDKFASLDRKQFEWSRSRVRDRIIRSFPNADGIKGAHSELGILKHEMDKKRRIMPLRKLFHEIPNLLLTLKPCLMMSPLSVAHFLNAEDYHFDMVIFDEASQVFPQDAIGAIFRADQVVIAGDTKQLPPTNFFSASTSNNDDYDDDDDWEEEIYDSILEETANVLPNRTLLWHYRSKHEHLIAFSNQEIYRGNLVTFPSSNESEPDTGVEFVFVEDGYYESGGRNCNIPEAKRCVELVKEHIDKHPERSLGIIAFSEKQQQAIALEIQRFREKNPRYEEFFAEGKDEEFFVKNLENVQGDERDTIFFSVGYARTKAQKATGKPMAMRFGPLGISGGERRLNVAITRAKTNVKLISSILPSDIDLNRTESDGIRMLRSYIEFAMNGEATLASANQNHAPDDFVDAIFKYISDKGYKAKQYVGCSGYKIDIAVEHPKVCDEFVAGIECDGVSYVSARTARDRDRLRCSVLKNMGWNLYRIWSTEWYRNPEVEGEKLIAFINNAIEESNNRLAAIEEQRRVEEERRKAEEEQRRVEEERRKAEEEQRRVEEERRKAEEEHKRIAKKIEEKQRQLDAQQREEKQKKAEATAKKQREDIEAKKKLGNKQISLIEWDINQSQEETRQKSLRDTEGKQRRESVKPQSSKAVLSSYPWAKVGARVQHAAFGTGIIQSIEEKAVTVLFPSGTKRLLYPDAFTKGYLKQPEASKPKPQQQSRNTTNRRYDWVKKGALVVHPSYGKGIIISLDGKYVTVRFQNGDKKFPVPSAFTDGYLLPAESKTSAVQNNDKNTPVNGGTSPAKDVKRGILEELVSNGFTCIDNRATSSIIWVIYEEEKRDLFMKITSKYHAPFKFERRGAMATGGKAAWRIMC